MERQAGRNHPVHGQQRRRRTVQRRVRPPAVRGPEPGRAGLPRGADAVPGGRAPSGAGAAGRARQLRGGGRPAGRLGGRNNPGRHGLADAAGRPAGPAQPVGAGWPLHAGPGPARGVRRDCRPGWRRVAAGRRPGDAPAPLVRRRRVRRRGRGAARGATAATPARHNPRCRAGDRTGQPANRGAVRRAPGRAAWPRRALQRQVGAADGAPRQRPRRGAGGAAGRAGSGPARLLGFQPRHRRRHGRRHRSAGAACQAVQPADPGDDRRQLDRRRARLEDRSPEQYGAIHFHDDDQGDLGWHETVRADASPTTGQRLLQRPSHAATPARTSFPFFVRPVRATAAPWPCWCQPSPTRSMAATSGRAAERRSAERGAVLGRAAADAGHEPRSSAQPPTTTIPTAVGRVDRQPCAGRCWTTGRSRWC